MNEAIFVQGLTKAYNGKTVVDHLDIAVHRGTVFGLLGPNGAGKSTTIECILGTKQADAGTVRLLGQDPQKQRRALFERIGVQFQEGDYHPEIKVSELCEETASLYRDPADWRALCGQFGIGDKAGAAVKGLSGGERVSQKIVMEALTFGSTLQANQVPTALPGMVAGINRAVNQMLGPKGLYTSGSTVVSALITGNALRWISVGDSRVYLYRDGQLSQLSRDHDLLQDWMPDILEGKRSMAEALRDPNGRKLTSFIGMGELRHVDYNRTPIPLLPGDRVLLMSDGVYGTVSDAEMAAILRDCGSVQLAASHIGQRIMGAALPYQDNYTLIVLGYDPPDQPRNNR